jgi:hypothetical protein
VHSNDGGPSRLRPVSIPTQIVPLLSQVYLFNAIAIRANKQAHQGDSCSSPYIQTMGASLGFDPSQYLHR